MKCGTNVKYKIEYQEPLYGSWLTTTLFRENHIKSWLLEHGIKVYRVYKIVDEVHLMEI